MCEDSFLMKFTKRRTHALAHIYVMLNFNICYSRHSNLKIFRYTLYHDDDDDDEYGYCYILIYICMVVLSTHPQILGTLFFSPVRKCSVFLLVVVVAAVAVAVCLVHNNNNHI